MEQESLALAEIERLEKLVADDPGAPAFSALADAHRRAGQPEKAEQISRDGLRVRPEQVGGRVVLGLALLDQGREAEARAELERALEEIPDHVLAGSALDRLDPVEPAQPGPGGLDAIDDAELEAAFESAEPDRDSMLDADAVAHQALRQVEVDEAEDALDTSEDSPFATQTVAELLERQGDAAGAEAIRHNLRSRESASDPGHEAGAAQRDHVIAALERWLGKIVRGRSR